MREMPPAALRGVLDAIAEARSNGLEVPSAEDRQHEEQPKPNAAQHMSNGNGPRDSTSNEGAASQPEHKRPLTPDRAPSVSLGALATLVQGVRWRGDDSFSFQCPGHEDRQASASATSKNGKILLKCFAGCSVQRFIEPLGLTVAQLFEHSNGKLVQQPARRIGDPVRHETDKAAERKAPPPKIVRSLRYPIADIDGDVKAVHVREDYDDGSKTMWWELPSGKKGLGGLRVTDLPLYGISRTIESADGEVVVLCEGQKAADSLWKRGILAVATVTGAASIPCDDSLKPLVRFKTCTWRDNDEPGADHMERIGRRLIELGAREVFTINWKDAPPKGDAADFEGDVDALLDSAEPFELEPRAHAQPEEPASFSDPISLDMPALPALPVGIFPPWSESFIDAVAEATETPRELAAMMELGVLATANQRKYVVQLKRGYSEPLNLWVLPALPSGHRKTQVLHALTKSLRRWEAEQLAELAPRAAEAESQRETALARVAVLRAKAARTDDSADYAELQRQIQELESSLPEIPATPRKWLQDVTPERLAVLMADNSEAMSLIDDEGGIFDILAGRYNNGIPNLDLFLQAHSGAPVRVDRGSRASVVMEEPALTLVLSPQPDILQGLAAKPGFRARGLLARCLYVLPLSNLGYRAGNTQPVPEAVSEDHDAHIRALLGFRRPETGPETITLSDQAYAEWRDFADWVETSMREGGCFEQLQDWAGKLPGAAARIAGNLHVADHAFGTPANSKLSADTMQRAIGLAGVLSKHAVVAFDLMGADEALKAARKVWGWVVRERKPKFTFRDCFNALRGTYPRAVDLERPMEVLIERHHIALLESPPRAGRPTRIYEVNPKLSMEWES
jgi:hypothetical protein